MKVIKTATPVKAADYAAHLREKLNPLFFTHKKADLQFEIENSTNTIEILKNGLYEGFLFRFEFFDNEIHVIKTEHYTDDVNVLTLEDILNNLYLEYPGRENIQQIEERS
jgi:hypothetical protein